MYLLEPLGLGHTENDVYLTLLDTNRATPAELAEQLELPPPSVRAALTRLRTTGLVHQIGGQPMTYAAVSPDVSVAALVQRRRNELAQVQVQVEELTATLASSAGRKDKQFVELIEGEDAVIAAATQLQLQAREELMGIDAPPYLGGQFSPNDLEFTQIASGVVYRSIYAPEALSSPEGVAHMRRCVDAGEQARILPGVRMKMAIADRKVALLPTSYDDPDPSRRLLVRTSALLDVAVTCYESLWAKAAPVVLDDTGNGDLSARDRQLLALLAAGMKDRSIARTMGVTERTIGRRVTDLMHLLDAETRFQAGIQAVRRGWM